MAFPVGTTVKIGDRGAVIYVVTDSTPDEIKIKDFSTGRSKWVSPDRLRLVE